MDIRIIKWNNVIQHCQRNEKMLLAFSDFYNRLKYTSCEKPQDLILAFSNSDLIKCKKTKQNRIIFNVGSNKYRFICGYFFSTSQAILFVKFVGTHTEYDSIDVCTVNMFKK